MTAEEVVRHPIAFRMHVIQYALRRDVKRRIGRVEPPAAALTPFRVWRTTSPGFFFVTDLIPPEESQEGERRVPEEAIRGLEGGGGRIESLNSIRYRLEKVLRGEPTEEWPIGVPGAVWPPPVERPAQPAAPSDAIARAQEHHARVLMNAMSSSLSDDAVPAEGSVDFLTPLLFGPVMKQMQAEGVPRAIGRPDLASHIPHAPMPAWPWALRRLPLGDGRHAYVQPLGGELVVVYAYAGKRLLGANDVVRLPVAFRARCLIPDEWKRIAKARSCAAPDAKLLEAARFWRKGPDGETLLYDWTFDPDRNHIEVEAPARSHSDLDGREPADPMSPPAIAERLLQHLAREGS